jgi:hypothetical protein
VPPWTSPPTPIASFNFSTIALVNEGVITKTAGTGTTTLDARLTNTGTISAEAGTVRLARSGTSAGMLLAEDGAAIEFVGGGIFTLPAGSVVSGAGTLGLVDVGAGSSSPTVTVEGTWSPAAMVLQRSTAGGSNPTLNIDSAANATTGSVTHNGGTIGGSGTLIVTGMYQWNEGAQGGTGLTVVQGGLIVGGSAGKTFSRRPHAAQRGCRHLDRHGQHRPQRQLQRGHAAQRRRRHLGHRYQRRHHVLQLLHHRAGQ